MKLTALLPLAALLLPALATAATLQQSTPVLAAPESAANTIMVLPAGTETQTAAEVKVPAGWTAISLTGPHTVFVDDRDLLKNFDVKPGAAYRTAPEKSAPALANATAGDSVEITGLSGRWLQLSLKRDLIGYIQGAPTATKPAAVTPVPVPAPAPATLAPATPIPAIPATGRAVEAGGSALPRIFQGTLASSRAPFRPRRPYDYQINDSRGVRYAYLDLSRLLLTEQIESYLGRTVEIFGTATNLADTKDIVIKVETLKLP